MKKPKAQTEVEKLEATARKLAAARKIQRLQAEIKAEQQTFILQKKDLAKALNVSRPTLDRALAKENSPAFVDGKGWPFEAVKKWLLNTVRGTMVSGRIDQDIGDLKRWEIYERARRMQVRNDKEVGLLMPKAEVVRQFAHCISECVRIFEAIPDRIAPEIVGLTVPAAAQVIRSAIREGIKEIRREP